MKRSHSSGFTLIELMIVVAIVAILAAVAYPSYQNFVLRGGRADGQAKLMEIMQAQERYYSQNQTYVTNLGAGGLGLGVAADAAVPSAERRYTIAAAACAGSTIANCVNLTATRTGAQATDNECGNLSINSRGVKAISGTGSVAHCW
ncbi:type IV pilin protein [Pseudomonas sp. Q1-7]|uniref:type IV pilin protein n=1 Tax=Pseudomonas sp. Q1-7 TaxID=3020843 RepID=UPI0022FFDFC2|nr:type IV pilin protein [Pseudomonas sp. Q1-7]